MRRFKDLIASFGWTVLDRMTSEISRFCAISSLSSGQQVLPARYSEEPDKLDEVALSICSSRAEFEANQLVMVKVWDFSNKTTGG